MELRQLEHFVAVSETRHFTRAAHQVHLTQSSLSASIRTLEREVGAALFVRSTRTVELTEAGRALLPAARTAVAAAEQGRDAVAAVQGVLRGRLRIGVIQTMGHLELAATVAEFHRRHPEVVVTLHNAPVAALVRQVVDGELELAFVDRPLGPDGERLDVRTLGRDSLVLAVPAGHRLAVRRRVRLPSLADLNFVEYRADSALRARIDEVCTQAGLLRRSRVETDTVAGMVDLVGHDAGVALLPEAVVRAAAPRIVGVRTDPAITRDLVAVTARSRAPSPAAAALLELVPTSLPRRG